MRAKCNAYREMLRNIDHDAYNNQRKKTRSNENRMRRGRDDEEKNRVMSNDVNGRQRMRRVNINDDNKAPLFMQLDSKMSSVRKVILGKWIY